MDKDFGPSRAAWFFVRDKGRFWKILHEEVLFIEARKSYCHIQTREKSWLILALLGNFESVLPAEEFLRVHRGYIINLRHLQSFDLRTAYLPGHQIPIGESYRTVVKEHVLRGDLQVNQGFSYIRGGGAVYERAECRPAGVQQDT